MGDKVTEWTGIDEAHRLPSADQTVIDHLRDSWQDGDRLLAQMEARLQQMRADQEGHPAGSTEPGDANRTWCFIHDAPLYACVRVGRNCPGELVNRPNDPTSAAATNEDTAAAHYAELVRLAREVTPKINRMCDLAAMHPINPQVNTAEVVECPDDWCVDCFTDAGYHEPVGLDSRGNPYYERRCRWCGQFKAKEGFSAPRWLLHYRHVGTRITQGMVDRARAERPKPTKKGKKSAA